ncbi:MAG: hypothetical protein LBF93_00345 [Zoogloeaceae bacterium]|jgi:hypothetical protein|nr:hypothetical protein [Zoogloeaceae bacterium]
MNVPEKKILSIALSPRRTLFAPLARIKGRDGDGRGAMLFRALSLGSGFVARLRRMLSPSLLLLVWDVGRLSAVTAWRQGRTWHFSEESSSRLADFAPALDEALGGLEAVGIRMPRRCYLAARFIVPARVDLPVDPEKLRPRLQMRELARAEMEPAVSEAGALWTIGAVLAARGLIGPEDRERIALELALRREQSNVPTYFGQVACDLGLIGKADLQAALHLQEKLQTLESTLACGWTGYRGESGEPPVWLTSACGLSLWSRFELACKRRGLKLLGGLPLAWSVSEAAGDATHRAALRMEPEGWTDERRHSRIALEIHAEDVVAVLRHRGRVVSARVEGRMERALAVDWLLRLVADWRASGVGTLEIVCLAPGDEAAVKGLLDDFAQQWGQSLQWRGAAATRLALLDYMAGQYQARIEPLPLIRFGELPRPLWKRTGFWHLCLPLLALTVVTGVGIRQRMEIKAIQTRMDLAELEVRRSLEARKTETGFLLEARQGKQKLDDLRRQLARLMPEVERLQTIENMASHLPQLLRALAQHISDDLVLEVVRNSRSGGNISDIMVVGWTNNYSSAQDFALRLQGGLAGFGYSVAQTDVRAGDGRDGNPGYFVSFWLIPRTPVEELGLEEDSVPAVSEKAKSAEPVNGTEPETGEPEGGE